MAYEVYWSAEAEENLKEILFYLRTKWSEKEVIEFKRKLNRIILLIASRPELFPISIYNRRFRKAVMSPQTSIFYEIGEGRITLAFIFLNKKNPSRLSEGICEDWEVWVAANP